jgi:hypothetical protein
VSWDVPPISITTGKWIWAVDARSDAPAFTNLGFVMDAQLFPLDAADDVELAIA